MKTRSRLFVVLAAALLALPMAAKAVVITDTFDSTSLDPMWTLDKDSTSGGTWQTPGGFVGSWDVGNNAYAHLQTTSTYDTTAGIRADAVMRQDHYPVATWGMGVGIYYNNNNWVSIKQSAAGGASGWLVQAMVDGSITKQQWSNDVADLRTSWLISGVELTSSQIKFYGSSIKPIQDQFGVTNIDAQMHELTELAMARPANFTGQATIIIGKGFSSPGYTGLDFDNSVGSDATGFAAIDYARINVVPEPATICLLIAGAAGFLRRKA